MPTWNLSYFNGAIFKNPRTIDTICTNSQRNKDLEQIIEILRVHTKKTARFYVRKLGKLNKIDGKDEFALMTKNII